LSLREVGAMEGCGQGREGLMRRPLVAVGGIEARWKVTAGPGRARSKLEPKDRSIWQNRQILF
jgi:hypothetical protein